LVGVEDLRGNVVVDVGRMKKKREGSHGWARADGKLTRNAMVRSETGEEVGDGRN
jgi:hypothetical protein